MPQNTCSGREVHVSGYQTQPGHALERQNRKCCRTQDLEPTHDMCGSIICRVPESGRSRKRILIEAKKNLQEAKDRIRGKESEKGEHQ